MRNSGHQKSLSRTRSCFARHSPVLMDVLLMTIVERSCNSFQHRGSSNINILWTGLSVARFYLVKKFRYILVVACVAISPGCVLQATDSTKILASHLWWIVSAAKYQNGVILSWTLWSKGCLDLDLTIMSSKHSTTKPTLHLILLCDYLIYLTWYSHFFRTYYY